MDQKLLTTLGCSGSVLFSLLGANPAGATEYVFTAPEANNGTAQIPTRETDYPFADCSCDGYDAETAAEIDRQGDKAIQLYGCDCAGCRNLVRNLAKEQPQS